MQRYVGLHRAGVTLCATSAGGSEPEDRLCAAAQGVIKLGDKRAESKCTLVYGQMNEPPGARARVALTGGAA
jgi:hypothetical protein